MPTATCLPGERGMRLSTLPRLRKDFVRACDTPNGKGVADGYDMTVSLVVGVQQFRVDSENQLTTVSERTMLIRCKTVKGRATP
jgi:hypothetical protein